METFVDFGISSMGSYNAKRKLQQIALTESFTELVYADEHFF